MLFRQIMKRTFSEVVAYHDETRASSGSPLNGSVFFLVPHKLMLTEEGTLFGTHTVSTIPSKLLYERVMALRSKHGFDGRFHFRKISGNKAEKELVNTCVEALKIKRTQLFRPPLQCKLAVIFYPNPRDLSMYGGSERKEKRLRHDETLMRMLFKGALHFLYDEHNRVRVLRIVSDGNPYHRALDGERILQRLNTDDVTGKTQLRQYAEISRDAEIVQQSSQHKEFQADSEEHIHATMLQLTDMLLGCVVCSCFKKERVLGFGEELQSKTQQRREKVALPVREMTGKRRRGRDFCNSSHYRSFTLSKAWLEDEVWKFESLMTKEIQIDCRSGQMFFSEFGAQAE